MLAFILVSLSGFWMATQECSITSGTTLLGVAFDILWFVCVFTSDVHKAENVQWDVSQYSIHQPVRHGWRYETKTTQDKVES